MSALERKLNAGQFVVTAEMPVIDGGGKDEIVRQLEPMQAYVDAFNATDNPSAHAHCAPLAVAIALREVGVEPVMQLVCRDRNRLGLEADLVGASMHGIENICCLTGDDVTAGDEPEARRVFDVDGVQLVSIARSLADGHYLSGRRLSPAPHFFVGAVENPGAPPMDYRVRRAAKKALAGARFLQLQICYRTELLERFMEEAHENGLTERIAMIPSICILRTVGGMRFVATRVPGIDVPATTVARVTDPEAECFEIAFELATHALAQPGVAGLHFISFRKDAGIAKLCRRLGIAPRIERETNGHSASLARR
jgi:methylenetetrahydrofolate reductase (NADPH)